MPFYRVTLTVRSPLGTPIHSGTLWGHLAWAARYLDGEAALKSWLAEQERSPWLLSSAMPEGMLPRPLLAPGSGPDCRASLRQLEEKKRRRKLAFISEAVFLQLRSAMDEDALDEALAIEVPAHAGMITARIAHNTIDRTKGRTPEQGGLYFKDDYFPPSEGYRMQVFIHTPNDDKEMLSTLFEYVGNHGFGRDASTGRGVFTHNIKEEQELFRSRGNRAMSLSHGVITEDMRDPRYKLHTHYGKLGAHWVNDEAGPFKFPILMAKPGGTFAPQGEGPFGRLLGGPAEPVHRRLLEVRHHALHLPLYFEERTA